MGIGYPLDIIVCSVSRVDLYDYVYLTRLGHDFAYSSFATVMVVCAVVSILACISLGEKNILVFVPNGWTFDISILTMDNGVGLIEVWTTSNGVRNGMASFLSLVLSWEFL